MEQSMCIFACDNSIHLCIVLISPFRNHSLADRLSSEIEVSNFTLLES